MESTSYTQYSSNESMEEDISEENLKTDATEEIILPNEEYKNISIINFKEMDFYKNDFNNYSLFEKKIIAEKRIKEHFQEYSIDDLLYLDQTNKDIQNYHMKIAIDKLNSTEIMNIKRF